MRRVVIVTNTNPFDTESSHYAHDATTDCLRRGEAPLATCGISVENEEAPDTSNSMTSLDVAEAWLKCADALVVFVDQGVSANMRYYIEIARRWNIEVDFRTLAQWASNERYLPA